LQFHIKDDRIMRRESTYSVPSDDVRNLRVIEDVYVSSNVFSVTENPLANSDTQI